jgi:predicted kinase
MFIMVGVPGSGKSTATSAILSAYGAASTLSDTIHAQNVKRTPREISVCSADDYFITENNEYVFDATKLHAAHTQSQNKARYGCMKKSVVVIDNTNLTHKERASYERIALEYEYDIAHVCIKIPMFSETKIKEVSLELEKRNKHGVPSEKITLMISKLTYPEAHFIKDELDFEESHVFRSSIAMVSIDSGLI